MYSKGCLFVCVFVSVYLVDVIGQVSSLCRPKERFLSCGGCQPTCRSPAPACVSLCRAGCYCAPGEVRNDTGHCVQLEDCPPPTPSDLNTSEPRTTDHECPENEEYRFCEPCNKTCDNPNPICPAQCARGCFCVKDLVRNKDGKCVELKECSAVKKNESSNYIKPIPYQLTCGPHQVYRDCQECERTCSSSEPVCSKPCSAGCFCESGYVKAPSGQCVKLEECPKAEISIGEAQEPNIEDCMPDEIYLQCGWCEPSCSEPKPECPKGVCTRGCLCRTPLLRHHSGQCVEVKDCAPQRCPDTNEEFVCRYGCEARCDGRKCTARPRRCTLGCHCKLGLRRDITGHCVLPENCLSPEFMQTYKPDMDVKQDEGPKRFYVPITEVSFPMARFPDSFKFGNAFKYQDPMMRLRFPEQAYRIPGYPNFPIQYPVNLNSGFLSYPSVVSSEAPKKKSKTRNMMSNNQVQKTGNLELALQNVNDVISFAGKLFKGIAPNLNANTTDVNSTLLNSKEGLDSTEYDAPSIVTLIHAMNNIMPSPMNLSMINLPIF